MDADHHDPFNEGTVRAIERLMAVSVLIEAGSRVAAENARSSANRAEQRQRDDVARQAAARRANRIAAAQATVRARQWARFAADPQRLRSHLERLPFPDLARHWADAARHADHNATAATVLTAAEEHLTRRAPGLMDYYRQQHDGGVPREQAMAQAAWLYDRHRRRPARRHGGRPATAGALTQIGADLEHGLRELVNDLDPIAHARLLHTLEAEGWSPEALTHIERLLNHTNNQSPVPDPPKTTPDRPPTRRTATAPQLAAESFPVPATQVHAGNPARHTAAGGPARRMPRRRSL